MAEEEVKPEIIINRIGVADIKAAYRAGLADFFCVPGYGLFFGGVYFLGGVFILVSLMLLKLPFLAFPLAVGFAMIAPFIAGGLYEVSRKLERGEYLAFKDILGSVRGHVSRDLGWMALVTTFAFYIWTDFAGIIYLLFFGLNLKEPMEFFHEVFFTEQGWMFLALGNAVGAVVSLIVFSITAISFPLLHDHDFDFVTAMITSVKTVFQNPGAMIVWCFSIVAILFIAFAAAGLGLLVALPVLGHTTWHVYRRAITLKPAAPEAG